MSAEVFATIRKLLQPRGAAYTEKQLRAFETKTRCRLPADYREFLVQVGPGTCTWGKPRRPVVFYRLEEIFETYETFFDDPSWIFTRYIPVGADEQLQEFYVFSLERESGLNFARIWHETVPEGWEEYRWRSFIGWLQVLSTCDGRLTTKS